MQAWAWSLWVIILCLFADSLFHVQGIDIKIMVFGAILLIVALEAILPYRFSNSLAGNIRKSAIAYATTCVHRISPDIFFIFFEIMYLTILLIKFFPSILPKQKKRKGRVVILLPRSKFNPLNYRSSKVL